MRVEITGTVGKLKATTEFDAESESILMTMAVKMKVTPQDVARILFLQKKKQPLSFSIGCKQSAFDLVFTEQIEQGSLLDAGVKKPMDEALKAVEAEKTEEGKLISVCEPAAPVKLVECPECHGSGQSKDPGFCCDICRGEGSVSARAVNPEEIIFSVEHHPPEPGNNGNGKMPKRRGRKSKKEAIV